MRKLLPDALGTAGYGLLVAGLYVQWGQGIALLGGGLLLILGALVAGSRA